MSTIDERLAVAVRALADAAEALLNAPPGDECRSSLTHTAVPNVRIDELAARLGYFRPGPANGWADMAASRSYPAALAPFRSTPAAPVAPPTDPRADAIAACRAAAGRNYDDGIRQAFSAIAAALEAQS